MKSKLIIGLISVMALIGWNINKSQDKILLSELSLANVEALAHCESEVKHGAGRETELECYNSRGERYSLTACHFDMGYVTDCEGVPVD